MNHLPPLIADLGFILITASAVTLLFKKLGQPAVLGYILAGFLLGPNIPFVPTITDTASVKVWAEMGVIVLLFGLGLEFSFKKLLHVGRVASTIAVVEVVAMLAMGYLCGQAFGWSKMDSLFLGGALSISSTTIIVRAIDELGLKSRRFVGLVFGVLIVEDLIAVLLLVLFSTIAISQNVSSYDLAFASLKLGFFLVLWFVAGIYFLPTLMLRIRQFLSHETVLIVSLGLCLMMVLIAHHAGFSPALGAFVMGSLLAETKEGPRIEHIIHPVRDLFAAVFFVSVGMMIDPQILIQFWPQIAIIVLVTLVGKLVSSSFGALLSGQSLRHSVQIGMSLAQIGEFSFIIAGLGMTLHSTSDFLYPIAVAVSAVTTLATPYMMKFADPLHLMLEKKLPKAWQESLVRHQNSFLNSKNQKNNWSLVWKAYGWKIIFNFSVVVALVLIKQNIQWDNSYKIYATLGLVLFSTPFLWGISLAESSEELSQDEKDFLDQKHLIISSLRGLVSFLVLGFIVGTHDMITSAEGLLLYAAGIVLFNFTPISKNIYQKIEKRFLKNLNQKSESKKSSAPQLAPWDLSLSSFIVHPLSLLAGKTLSTSHLKENYDVMVVMVERGDHQFLSPGSTFMIMPHDRIYLVGSDEQKQKAQTEIEQAPSQKSETESQVPSFVGLRSIRVNEQSLLVNQSLSESRIKENYSGLVVGIERGTQRILNPGPRTIIHLHDLLWVVGDLDQLKKL